MLKRREPERIPDIPVPEDEYYLIDMYWEMRSFVGPIDSEGVITIQSIRDWQDHHGVHLERWERKCMFELDRAFRRAYIDVVKFHSGRTIDKTNKGK